jgi:hypothetical protein
MFSQGQLYLQSVFFVAFVIAMIFATERYKNSQRILQR